MKILKMQQFITPHVSKGHEIQQCIVNEAEILSLNLGRKANPFYAKQMTFTSRLTFHKTNAIEIHNVQVKHLEVAAQLAVFSFFSVKSTQSWSSEQLEKKENLSPLCRLVSLSSYKQFKIKQYWSTVLKLAGFIFVPSCFHKLRVQKHIPSAERCVALMWTLFM